MATRTAKNTPRSEKMGLCECVFGISKILITSGYGAGFLLVAGFVGTCYVLFGGMDSDDKRAVLEAFIGWPLVGFSGWIGMIVVIFVAKRLFNLQAEAYERQLKTIRKTKDDALLFQQKLNLPDSGNPNK